MNRKKRLFMKNPIIWNSLTYGDLLSILDDNAMPWVYNNFIQLEYSKTWGIFAFENHHLLMDNCPALEHYSFPKKVVLGVGTIIDFIIDMIDLDYYILKLSTSKIGLKVCKIK